MALVSATAFANIPYASKEFVKQTYDMCVGLQDIGDLDDELLLGCINDEMYNLDYREFDTIKEVRDFIEEVDSK